MFFVRQILVALIFLKGGVTGLLKSSDDKEFEVIPNPYEDFACVPSLDAFLEPYYLLTKPMATQADTFQDLTYTKIMGVPIPTYRMKQPARLSSAELEYQLVLVSDLTTHGKSQIKTASVDIDKAKDSWFPGYYWNPLFMFCSQAKEWQHVGWKFTSLDDGFEGNNSRPFFYALMVKLEERKKEAEAAYTIMGFKAPGWIGSQLQPL